MSTYRKHGQLTRDYRLGLLTYPTLKRLTLHLMSRDDESFVSHRASPYRAKKRDDCRHKRYEEISLLMVIHECHSVVGLDLDNCVSTLR